MFTVTVFRPAEPRANALLVVLWGQRQFPFVLSGDVAAKILLDTFAYEFLFTIEFIPDIIKRTTALVLAVLGDRK